MRIVIDTSAILSVVLGEPHRDVLIEMAHGAELLAPPSVHWEITNALTAMLKRKRITLSDGLKALEIYSRIPIRYTETELDESLKIAAAQDIYADDAYVIRCGIKYGGPILTLDRGLVRAAAASGAEILEVTP